jgi:hydroxyacylglutathione hydrolase
LYRIQFNIFATLKKNELLQVKSFTFNPFEENTYVVSNDKGEAIFIDPGCYLPKEKESLDSYIETKGLRPLAIYNTHCHIDHILGAAYIKEKYKIPLKIHEKDLEWLKAVRSYASNYGFEDFQEVKNDGFYDEETFIFEGEDELEVLFLPGHSPGHTGLVNRKGRFCIVGDVLFDGSIGRTDLPGGDHDTLIRSIQEKLFKLPEDFNVFCGHGPNTTIGKEKQSNPFCALK